MDTGEVTILIVVDITLHNHNLFRTQLDYQLHATFCFL